MFGYIANIGCSIIDDRVSMMKGEEWMYGFVVFCVRIFIVLGALFKFLLNVFFVLVWLRKMVIMDGSVYLVVLVKIFRCGCLV